MGLQHYGRCSHVHEQSTIQISLKNRPRCYACETTWLQMLHMNMNTLRHSHVQVRLPGSGLHIPLDIQVAVIFADGTNELHLKNISAPSIVF